MSYSSEEIEALVRKVVNRVMGEEQTGSSAQFSSGKRPLLTADHIQQLPPNSTFTVPTNALITPLARQAALERHIQLQEGSDSQPKPTTNKTAIAIGADHGGYALKETLKNAGHHPPRL